MDKNLCEKFKNVWTNFNEKLIGGNYKINDDGDFKQYCSGQNCVNELEKINAGCLYLFDAFFGNSSSRTNHSSINVVDYIMIWLIYMLSLKGNETKDSLQHFYKTNINNQEKYTNSIKSVEGCNNYKDLILKNHDLTNRDMDNNIISELYDAFKLLCKMYTGFDESTSNCTNCLQYAKEFFEKYEKLNKESNIINNGSFNQILSTLSTDYNKLKDKCSDSSSFPLIELKQISALKSGETSSSSSIANKLFIVLSIFGAIAIFLGISYKVNNELKNIFIKYMQILTKNSYAS
ncbi:hypothetical protein YYC_02858 [Plasmodium yoelii 17X]|uniref:Uncharacterized protein n=1 Tax=Plasmodium yoelii 17X TaxID=1323249 RepID=V7PK18_PLAYE|nr:hypothetical protein YYC_02858 [Plasmodium yoelii 17X]